MTELIQPELPLTYRDGSPVPTLAQVAAERAAARQPSPPPGPGEPDTGTCGICLTAVRYTAEEGFPARWHHDDIVAMLKATGGLVHYPRPQAGQLRPAA